MTNYHSGFPSADEPSHDHDEEPEGRTYGRGVSDEDRRAAKRRLFIKLYRGSNSEDDRALIHEEIQALSLARETSSPPGPVLNIVDDPTCKYPDEKTCNDAGGCEPGGVVPGLSIAEQRLRLWASNRMWADPTVVEEMIQALWGR